MHYARYDGGVGLLVDEANGVSSVLVGRGVSGTTLISSVCAMHDALVARLTLDERWLRLCTLLWVYVCVLCSRFVFVC